MNLGDDAAGSSRVVHGDDDGCRVVDSGLGQDLDPRRIAIEDWLLPVPELCNECCVRIERDIVQPFGIQRARQRLANPAETRDDDVTFAIAETVVIVLCLARRVPVFEAARKPLG